MSPLLLPEPIWRLAPIPWNKATLGGLISQNKDEVTEVYGPRAETLTPVLHMLGLSAGPWMTVMSPSALFLVAAEPCNRVGVLERVSGQQ